VLSRRAPAFWQRDSMASRCLLPLSVLYRSIARQRKAAYKIGRRPVIWPDAGVVVIGNITVGGTGKTPLVVWAAGAALEMGLRPGVILRGYGGRFRGVKTVQAGDDPVEVGDEAVLIAQQTGLPVVVGADRAAAAEAIVAEHGVNLVISDDGLQHFRLGRDIEIAVIDAARGFGNGRCLPAGPLREPVSRLAEVDAVMVNGEPVNDSYGGFTLEPDEFRELTTDRPKEPVSRKVHAVAGIGHPQRFFNTLKTMGYAVVPHSLGDHHAFVAKDFAGLGDRPVVMTEKDAVRCRHLDLKNAYYLRVTARPDAGSEAAMRECLATAMRRYQARKGRQ